MTETEARIIARAWIAEIGAAIGNIADGLYRALWVFVIIALPLKLLGVW